MQPIKQPVFSTGHKFRISPRWAKKKIPPQEVEKQDGVGPCGEGSSEKSEEEEEELRRSERIAQKARQEFVSLLASIRESSDYGEYLAGRKSFFEPVPVLVGAHEHEGPAARACARDRAPFLRRCIR